MGLLTNQPVLEVIVANHNFKRTHKRCADCGLVFEISSFNNDKQQLDGHSVYCRNCRKLQNAKRYARDKEKIGAQVANWRSENKDRVKQINQRWYSENSSRACANGAAWRAKNKSKVRSFLASYKANKLRATPSWASKEAIEKIYAEAIRLSELTGIQYHVDHIVPLQSKYVCGLHCESNLRAVTWKENRSKSNSYWPDMP